MSLVVCDWLSGCDRLFVYSRHDHIVDLRVIVSRHLRQVLDELDVCVSLVPDQTHEEGEGNDDDLKSTLLFNIIYQELTIVWTGRFSKQLQLKENLDEAANLAASSPDGVGASAGDSSAGASAASATCSTLCSSATGWASPLSDGFSKGECWKKC